MCSEDKFWATIWAIGAAFLVAFMASITAYNIYEVKAIKQMVASGADPMSAACSVRNMNAAICGAQTVLASK